MGHLMSSALWTLQRQSQLRRCGGNVLLRYFIPFSILQKRLLIFSQWASVVCLPEHQKNEHQRHQKAPVFIGVAGALISFDTSHVFMVVGRRAPLLPGGKFIPREGGRGKLDHSVQRKPQLLWGAKAAVAAREQQKQCWVYQIRAGYSSSKASLWHITATPWSVMIYECLAASLPDVRVLCFPQELEAVHPKADPRRGSVQKRQVLGKGNQAVWKWQSPWALLKRLICLNWAASALYKLQVSLMRRRMLWKQLWLGFAGACRW